MNYKIGLPPVSLVAPLRWATVSPQYEHPIQAAYHSGANTLAMVFDMRQRLVVFARRMRRSVRRPVGEVEEERSTLVGLDNLDGLIGVVVSCR